MFESRLQPPLTRARFQRRLAMHGLISVGLLLASLAIGMAGYGYFEHLPWRDGFLNAAMLLGGMGPVHSPQSPGGKLFAGCFALYAGLVFVISVGVVLAPALHRAMHLFHWSQAHKH